MIYIKTNYKKAKKISRKITKERKSCKPSNGELRIAEFLSKECVKFYREYYMNGLYGIKGHFLYFDFYIPKYNLVIEFDGIYHYKTKNINILENDYRKDAFCKKRNINILRIPYWDIDKIEFIILDKIDKIDPKIKINQTI